MIMQVASPGLDPAWAIVIGVLGVGGIGGAITAFVGLKKAKPETAGMLVDAAEAVVQLQDKAIKDLRTRIEILEKAQSELDVLRNRIRELEAKLVAIEAENAALLLQRDRLEREVAQLRSRILTLEHNGGTS